MQPHVQTEVAYRIATMGKITPELLTDIESILESRVETVFGQDVKVAGGVKAVADILNMAGRSTEKTVLGDLEKRNPEPYSPTA